MQVSPPRLGPSAGAVIRRSSLCAGLLLVAGIVAFFSRDRAPSAEALERDISAGPTLNQGSVEAPSDEVLHRPAPKAQHRIAPAPLDRRITALEYDALLDRMSTDASDATLAELVDSLRGRSGSAAFLIDKAHELRARVLAGEQVGMDLWRTVFLLGELGDPSAIPALRAMALEPDLKDPSPSVFRSDYKAKTQAIQSLGRLGAVDELRGMLTGTSRIEGSVLVELSELGHPEPGYDAPPPKTDILAPPAPAATNPEDAPGPTPSFEAQNTLKPEEIP